MGIEPIFDSQNWSSVPFHFWSIVIFVFGALVGSFLNVCIHRMPLGQSVISPPSHCPHCNYSIPWFLNLPLATWLWLRGKCKNCGAPISIRYFLVELLTALLFLAAWLAYGRQSPLLALVYCLVLAAFIVATFIDLEHFIIPDEITLGGIIAGILCSFLVPALHGQTSIAESMKQSFIGAAFGWLLIYAILRAGKLLFGRQKLQLDGETKILFSESCLMLPDQEIRYEDVFYRDTDVIVLQARRVELIDRCYGDVAVRLSPERLRIGDDEFNPEHVSHMEALTSELLLPREAMGLGDVKFMAAIGAFLGWQSVAFSLMVSSVIGAVVGGALILMRKREWSSRLPYGPYIALAATIWIFGGREVFFGFFGR